MMISCLKQQRQEIMTTSCLQTKTPAAACLHQTLVTRITTRGLYSSLDHHSFISRELDRRTSLGVAGSREELLPTSFPFPLLPPHSRADISFLQDWTIQRCNRIPSVQTTITATTTTEATVTTKTVPSVCVQRPLSLSGHVLGEGSTNKRRKNDRPRQSTCRTKTNLRRSWTRGTLGRDAGWKRWVQEVFLSPFS